jgi:hypothetical protein
MKSPLIISIFLLFSNILLAQAWTAKQLAAANTASTANYLTDIEKEVIQYLNLCRLYPSDFAKIEVRSYNGVPGIDDPSREKYKGSLLKDLVNRTPTEPLNVHELLSNDAKCFANELSKSNRVGHERKECKGRRYAECLAFGNQTGREIVMEWLIDSGVESLGHRRNCLNSRYTKTGISIAPHKEYKQCAVAEFWY